MDDSLKKSILDSISLGGGVSKENARVIATIADEKQRHLIIASGSGLPKIKPNRVEQFKLELTQPLSVRALSPFEIRCCLCKKVVSYPVWHLVEKFAVKQIHFFVCFGGPKVTANCMRG